MFPRVGGLIVAGLASVAARPAHACPTNVVWPEPTWSVDLAHGASVTALDRLAFTVVGSDEQRLGPRTDGLLIVHQGVVIYEHYGRGFGPEHPHLTWSVSKSILEAMVGVAVHEGYLDLHHSICAYYDQSDACEMTATDLLLMASGIEWNEGYEDEPYHLSSVIAMLYGEGALDMAAFVAHLPPQTAPGQLYRYSSGDSVLLAAVVDGALPPAVRDQGAERLIFDPLGMQSALFERDRAGTLVGSSYAYATPRDMARFGYFYLRDGCWADQRRLPAGWVADSVAINPVFINQASFEWARDGSAIPGRQWWTNRSLADRGIDTAWPDVPEDAFWAAGHWGQSIVVIPSEDLVVVRTADDREPGAIDLNRLIAQAIDLAREHPR